jgi:hypothetical protein
MYIVTLITASKLQEGYKRKASCLMVSREQFVQATNGVENLPPSQIYRDLKKQIPGVKPTLRVLDKLTRKGPLNPEDTESLLTYALWVQAPDATARIAQVLDIPESRVENHIDRVMNELEPLWERFEEIQEEIEGSGEDDADNSIDSINYQPLFESPVNKRSRKTRSYNLQLIDQPGILMERLEELLLPREFAVAKAQIEGKLDDEISQELGISQETVKRYRTRARRKVEKSILYPAGYFRLRHEWRSLEVVVGRGENAEGVNFLGFWYGTKTGAEIFNRRSRKIDQTMLEQALEPISWYIHWEPKETYRLIVNLGKERGDLVKHGNRLYGKKADILALIEETVGPVNEELPFKDKVEKMQKSDASPPEIWDPPEPGLKQITEITDDVDSQRRLQEAARRGDIHAVKKTDHWFIDPIEANVYLAPPEPGLKRASEIANTVKDKRRLQEGARREKIYAVRHGDRWFYNPVQADAYLAGEIIDDPTPRS